MVIMEVRVVVILALFVLTVGGAFAANVSTLQAVSITGSIVAFDNSPHTAVTVQAVMTYREFPPLDGREIEGEGKLQVIATTLSDDSGKYQFTNLKPGKYQVRCYTGLGAGGDGYAYYPFNPRFRQGSTQESKIQNPKSVVVQPGRTLSDIDFRFAPFKKGSWRTYSGLDGLANNFVYAIHQDKDGAIWVGTLAGGVSKYDGKSFASLTTNDGLANNSVNAIHPRQR